MKKFFVSIEINLGDADATVFYTRLVNKKALAELRKTKVTGSQADYYQEDDEAVPFSDIAFVKEITDKEVKILQSLGLDHISVGCLSLCNEDGIETALPYDNYCNREALLNYVK